MRDFYRSFGILRNLDPETGTVEAVISTGNIARDQMIIDPEGWDFDNYRRNPVVLWGHDDSAMPLARTMNIEPSPNELRATAQFDMEDDAAKRLMRKIQGGFVNATSVRWLPKRWENRMLDTEKGEREVLAFVEQELLEWSFVSIPADPGAVILRADGSHVDLDAFRTPVPVPASRTLAECIEELESYIGGDLDEETRAALRTHYHRIASVVTEPVVTGGRLAAVLDRMDAKLAEIVPVDVDGIVRRTLAHATGRALEE